MKQIVIIFSFISLGAITASCGDKPPQSATISPTTQTNPTATQAAASGVGNVVAQVTKGNPIPREGVPDFVETMDGGRYLTGTNFSNDLRSGGSIMYVVEKDRAAVVAFYKTSFEKQGFQVTQENEARVRENMESKVAAESAAGEKLYITAIEKPDSVIVNLNYTVEAKK